MAFRVIPTKIKDAQNDLKAINKNFDQLYSDIIDQGGLRTGVANIDNTVAAGGAYRISITLVDSDLARRQIYVPDKTILIPRMDVFIDNDEDSDYLWPVGTALSSAQYADIEISMHFGRRRISSIDDSLATFFIHIKNHDASPHDFFVSADAFTFPSPPVSRFV